MGLLKRGTLVMLLMISTAFCKEDELTGSGMGNLKRGAILFPLSQISENVPDGKKVKEAYRLILSSGFSLQDLVLVQFEDDSAEVLWRSGLYENVSFGGADLKDFEEQYETKILSTLLKAFQEKEVWNFDKAFTGEAMDDGAVVTFARLIDGKETAFRTHRGNGAEDHPSIARFEKLGNEFWKVIEKEE